PLGFYSIFSFIVSINILLAVFNLIPIPPLDGSKLLFAILPRRFDHWKIFLAVRGPLILIFLIILDRLLNLSLLESLFNLVIRAVAGMFGLSLL
ncbi:MAG: Zn-dependent protease, partial [Parcubacteria group bacterium LiPW_72]